MLVNLDPGFWPEFLLEMDLEILLRKKGARLILKILHIYPHIDPDDHDSLNILLIFNSN